MKELMKWAKREIELVKNDENSETEKIDAEIDKHYDAAYSAYCAICEEINELAYPDITKAVLTQLIQENPLTPIEDNTCDWDLVESFDPINGGDNPGYSIYQCKRRPSLYKKITYNVENKDIVDVHFTDSERCVCIDVRTSASYTGGLGVQVLDEMVPITMPYMPIGKIKVYTEDFKYNKDSKGDYDTVGILYFCLDDGSMRKVMRFFKYDEDSNSFEEIDKSEYFIRVAKSEG